MTKEARPNPEDQQPPAAPGSGPYIAGSVYTGGGDFVAGDKYEIHPPTAKDARRRRDQLVLLEKVRRFWVNGVLEKSLYQTVRIELGLETRSDLISHPWESVVEIPHQQPIPLPDPDRIGDVFLEAGRALVILGDPGSGKTTTLLELASILLETAEADPAAPIPVVLNLSTWGEKRLSLADWVAEELGSKYQIPQKIGREWLADFDILLLLDGLDEIPGAHQAACVDAINQFGLAHGLSGIAVCSRIAEYAALDRRLMMGGAVVLQPLEDEQIVRYVGMLGESHAALQTTLVEDPALKELARSPLMLSVMTIAFEDSAVSSMQDGGSAHTLEERREQVFSTYVEKMFNRKHKGMQFSPERMREFLAWLASRMEAESQSLFMIENLQPSWLGHSWQIWVYALLSRVLGGLLLMLGFMVSGSENFLMFVVMPLLGLFGGGIAGLLAGRRFTGRQAGSPARGRLPVVGLATGVPLGLFAGGIGFVFAFSQMFQGQLAAAPPEVRWLGGALFSLIGAGVVGIVIGGIAGFIFEIVFGRRFRWQTLREDIRTVDALKWSWPLARQGTARGALAAAFFAPILALPIGMSLGEDPVEMALYIPVACCLVGALAATAGGALGFLLGGMRGVAIAGKTVPNSGIWLTVSNSLRIGGLVFILVGLLYSLLRLPDSLRVVYENFGFALVVAGIVVMFYGVLDFVQHFTLRTLLWVSGRMPYRLTRILDEADDMVLLRKVGGGYLFVHRLLQEHFAGNRPESR